MRFPVRFSTLVALFVSLVFVGAVFTAVAQEETTTTGNLSLNIEAAAVSEPTLDGLMFNIQAEGTVSGDWTGTISLQVSQRLEEEDASSNAEVAPIAVLFTITTEEGMISGYYIGSFAVPTPDSDATVVGAGRVLSASSSYADLYLADVLLSSTVDMVDGIGIGESGTITIIER